MTCCGAFSGKDLFNNEGYHVDYEHIYLTAVGIQDLKYYM